MKRLTEIAHEHLREALRPGDIAIDATAGNGHDTLALADAVGPMGHVYAFDIQSVALEATRRIVPANVTLILADHAEMRDHIPKQFHGDIAAITFNLGYLPGGNRAIVTRPDTTIAALQSAMDLLKPGGILTVMAYRAHDGGEIEYEMVQEYLKEKNALTFKSKEQTGPRLYVVSTLRVSTTISSPLL